MALSFPNQTRFYDAPRRAVQFWGHDSTMEAVFFVTEDALKRVQPGMRLDELGLLGAFDANRDLIHAAAAKVYASGRRGSYHLDSTDFQMVALLSAGFDGGACTPTTLTHFRVNRKSEGTWFSVCLAQLPGLGRSQVISQNSGRQYRAVRPVAHASTQRKETDDGDGNREVVQSDQGLRIHSTPGRRQGCVCAHFRCRARRIEHPQ